MKRRALAPLVVAGVLLALAGCAGDEAGSAPSQPTGGATPSATPTATATPEGFAVPESCHGVWSAEALAILSEEVGPLNDQGLTMLSTEVVPALEVLDAAEPLRCTWGTAGEVGIATTVAAVDDAQIDTLRSALVEGGFTCEDREAVTRCEREEEPGGPEQGTGGEVHVLGAGGWVATHWLNADFEPQYTDDIVATVWG